MKKKKTIYRILADWFLPPKVKELILGWFYRNEKSIRKNWFYQPIPMGGAALPCFTMNQKKAYWLSLSKEVRPGILIEHDAVLEIPLAADGAEWVQIGLGTNKDFSIERVEILIDGQSASILKNVLSEQWHDVRLPLAGKKGKIELTVRMSGKGPLFFAHPLIKQETIISKQEPIQNIICLILDGITPEYLQKDIAPRIRRFFSDGVICEQAFSQSDWTLPAFSSMLTGLYPSKHGVYNPDEYDSAIPDSIPVLTEILNSHQFRTFGYSGHIRFSPAYGHARGFERFIFAPLAYGDHYIREINEAIQHLEAHKEERNFLFLHFFDTHYPYQPAGYFKNILMKSSRDFSVYDGQFEEQEENQLLEYLSHDCKTKIQEVDLALNALFSYMEQQPWLKNSIVLLTTDHGISHRRKGMPLLFKDRVNIPLCVKGPRIIPGENRDLIEGNVDLMPSILLTAGLPCPENINGKVWPFLGRSPRRQVFTESLFRTVYQASIRDEKYSYHLRCPFDQRKRKIYFEKERTMSVFDRRSKEDAECMSSADHQENVFSKFKSYLEDV